MYSSDNIRKGNCEPVHTSPVRAVPAPGTAITQAAHISGQPWRQRIHRRRQPWSSAQPVPQKATGLVHSHYTTAVVAVLKSNTRSTQRQPAAPHSGTDADGAPPQRQRRLSPRGLSIISKPAISGSILKSTSVHLVIEWCSGVCTATHAPPGQSW
jgi:hypothetical protein